MARRAKLAMTAAVAALVLLGTGAAMAGAKKKRAPSKPIDLNHATIGQLEEIPGIGPVTARHIVEFREKSGPFKRVDDLLSIHGISQRRLGKIRPYVMVGPLAKAQPGAGSHPAKKPTGRKPGA